MLRLLLFNCVCLLTVALCCLFANTQESDSKEHLASLWQDMDSPDGLRALAAIKALGAFPEKVLPLVQEQLRTYRALDQANVDRWIANLDDDRFEVRERATAELKKLGERAELALHNTLADPPSVEMRRRGEKLLKLLEPPSSSPGRLRAVRIVYLLEEMSNPAAKKLLEALAKGPVGDQRALDAKSALDRLARRSKGRVEKSKSDSTLPEIDILVDDLSKYVKDPDAPLRKGTVSFRVRELEPMGSVTRITARDALSYNGFAMEYVLKATAEPVKLKGKTLSCRELRDVEITYTDDLLKAKGLGEKDLERLIQQLYDPNNRVQWMGTMIPGGEMLHFSDPMRQLIILGEKARHRMEQCLADPRIDNEAALVLGAIGNERTITLLIDAYPETTARAKRAKRRDLDRIPDVFDTAPARFDDAATAKAVYFTYALTYLTGHSIGRSRYGSDCSPENRRLWKEWWSGERDSFQVPKEKPRITWVPHYPTLSQEWARHAREKFARYPKD